MELIDGEFFRTIPLVRRGRIHFLSDYREFLETVGCHFTRSDKENAKLSIGFFRNVLEDYVESRLEYKEQGDFNITKSILAHFPDWMLNERSSPFTKYFKEVTEDFRADLADWIYDSFLRATVDDIHDFMGTRTWNVYLVSFDRHALNIEQYEDFRVHYFNTYIHRGRNEKRPLPNFGRRS